MVNRFHLIVRQDRHRRIGVRTGPRGNWLRPAACRRCRCWVRAPRCGRAMESSFAGGRENRNIATNFRETRALRVSQIRPVAIA